MKRIAVSFFVVAIGLAPTLSFAQSTTSDLMSQIQALNNQLLQLQQQQQQIQSQKQQVVSTLLTTLGQGSQGDAVKTLQALLASDPTIYPQGLITGFFGPATAQAVKRFQKAHGLDQVGNVGPKTLQQLNAWFKDHPVQFENYTSTSTPSSTANGGGRGFAFGRRLCTPLPPGHMNARGWLRKEGRNERQIIPFCQNAGTSTWPYPWQYPYSTSTTTTTPVISNIAATPSAQSATITWTTNENANSQILYGLTTAYGSQTWLDGSLVINHSQVLNGLATSTTYHYQVLSRDAYGNLATSPDQTFTTLAGASDTTAPVISNISAQPMAHSATVNWTTNENADSQVYYGTSTAYGLQTTLNPTLIANHSQVLSGLDASTLYHYQVLSRDAASNLATSPDQTFTTLQDTTAPVISSLSVAPAATTGGIYFLTNLQTTVKIYYSTVGSTLDPNATSTLLYSDSALNTVHNYTLPGLSTSTTYYYRIEATTAANGVVTSQGQFTTLAM
ncbi:MAG TPA: fibronectin type III domain-containing protein [Candidatus Paceibacterota bacterium]|nr:fibronectin type III domain-containing protein [Candidatus Paceibacterota bacterium]